jgi:phosphatidylinositol alpha-mannosyltransferase
VERSPGLTVRRLHHLLPYRLQRLGVSPFDSFGVTATPTLVAHRYEVVHCLAPSTAVAARLAGQPTVFTVLGHPTPEGHGGRSVRERLLRRAVRSSSVVTALSDASAAMVERLYGRRADVLPPGIRPEAFPPRAGAAGGPPRILFASALDDRRKGLDVAVRALGLLRRRHPDARLLLAGPGDPGWALDADSVGAVDVLGAGDLDDVARRYREATVTVLPARDEAFGLVLVESLASGTPVVCADQGGMPAIVDDPGVGRVVRFGDDEALAAGLADAIDLASRPDTARRCTEHARRWDWVTSVGPAHEAVYRSVVPAARTPTSVGKVRR